MKSQTLSFGTIVMTVALLATTASAQVQSAAQQKCLNGMTAALTKVAKAQQGVITACLKAAATGKLPPGQTAEQCLAADGKGKVAKAIAKTVETQGKLCATLPSFGFAGAAAVNGAGVGDSVDLEQAVFGPDLGLAAILQASDKTGAGCQAQVVKSTNQLLTTALGLYRGCKQAGLKGGTITSSATLDACIDAIATDGAGKIGKAIVKLGKLVATKCEGVTLAAAFPGACGMAPDLAACLALRARCETCQMAATADALARSCDVFDDGLANNSCGISCVDTDADGYGAGCAAGPDCDDALDTVHPGATELCNGRDDDCNTVTDDNPVGVGVSCDEPIAPPPGATSPCSAGVTACTNGALTCAGATGPTGADGCNVDANCDGVLTGQPDLQSDVNNCGACGNSCYAGSVHASFACNSGTCAFTGCQNGYYDLNGDQTCEYPCSFVSPQESCNGLDDNCNGQVDESLVAPAPSQVCGTSPLATTPECSVPQITISCQGGSWQCTFLAGICSPSCAAATDTCTGNGTTGIDNDCNGFVDDDQSCQSCSSIPESCNGCDDNCNGFADDGAPAVPCGLPSPPNCVGVATCQPPQAVPPGTCVAGGYGACSNSPIAESCDGIDNDCDGSTDDNILSSQCEPVGTPPGRSYGPLSQCKKGGTVCAGGVSTCNGYVGPSTEVCDGIDNDCDGTVDELTPGTGQACGINRPPCSPGLTACIGGALVCQGGVGPQPEVCDTIDNDCDGVADDTAFCPSGTCVEGTCIP